MIWKTLLYLIEKKTVQIEELLIKDIKEVLQFINDMLRPKNKRQHGKEENIIEKAGASNTSNSVNMSLISEDDDIHHYLNEEQFYALLEKLRLNDDKNFSKKLFTLF